MSHVRTPDTDAVSHAVTDVLVNRRRGRFELALTAEALLLCQDGEVEIIDLAKIGGVDATVTARRVRVRFRTDDGSAWTLRWFDSVTSRTGLILESLRDR